MSNFGVGHLRELEAADVGPIPAINQVKILPFLSKEHTSNSISTLALILTFDGFGIDIEDRVTSLVSAKAYRWILSIEGYHHSSLLSLSQGPVLFWPNFDQDCWKGPSSPVFFFDRYIHEAQEWDFVCEI